MSRIGKKPIEIPKDVAVDIQGSTIQIKGPKGELSWTYPAAMNVSFNEGVVSVQRAGDTKNERALHGLTRSVITNMVTGVSQGYKKVLDIVGIGYKAQASGEKIMLSLGYSHQIEFQLPPGVTASSDQKQVQITLSGVDKQQLGQVAASLKSLRSPDAYKGKGVRYSGQRLKLKVGKAGKK
jgi:large subunit ribosomal protein L6